MAASKTVSRECASNDESNEHSNRMSRVTGLCISGPLFYQFPTKFLPWSSTSKGAERLCTKHPTENDISTLKLLHFRIVLSICFLGFEDPLLLKSGLYKASFAL